MKCPRCQSETRVWKTRHRGPYTQRVHRCTYCGARFKSFEFLEAVFKSLLNRKKGPLVARRLDSPRPNPHHRGDE